MSEKSRSERCYCHCHQQHHLCCNRKWHGTPYCSKAAAEHVVMLLCHREARQKPEQDEVDFRRHLILRAIKPMSGLGDSIRGCAMHPSGILTLPLGHKHPPKAAPCSVLQILLNATVFARMSPGQKSSLVEELQKLE